MRKNLRMLCMAVAAVAFTSSFAQTDVTDKVMNPDMEKGVIGWDIDFTSTVWKKQTKNQATYPGYHGFHNLMLECWHGDLTTGIGNSTISQTLTDLPNGTYVFGVYAAAAHTVSSITSPNKDEVYGVNLFANEQTVPMATNPVEGMFKKWAHTAKFNVAVKVIDGTLKFGVKVEDTFINFVGLDEASLYFFGDMDADAALDEMAKIDIAKVIAIADTCVDNKMNADTLAHLNEMIEAAKLVTKNAELYQADEDLYWAIYLANKSAKDYATLASAIAAAKEVAAQEWTDVEETVAALEELNALIAECEAKYTEGTAISEEIPVMVAELAEASAVVELDAIYVQLDEYNEKLDSIKDFRGDNIGEYSDDMIEEFEDLLTNVDEELNMVGDILASEAKANCEKWFADMQRIIDNPLNYSEFPIWIYESDVLPTGQGNQTNTQAYPVIEGYEVVNIPAGTDYNGNSYGQRNNIVIYRSPLHRFREELKSVRFIIHKAGMPTQVDANGNANICVGEFAMFDEKDNRIPLTAYENVFSNCVEPKEGSLENLVDGNPGTFFHSLWSGGTPQEHYIEVDLPDGEYSAFRFVFVAYTNGHTRTFPRELEITYVSEKVTEMQQVMVAARELYPVFGTAPGFNNMDLTPFKAALARADELVLQAKQNASSVSDDEVWELTRKIEEEAAKIKEAGVMLPEEGKEYRIVSREDGFMPLQNVQKAVTIREDSTYGHWLWWQDACADSVQQVFTLEPIENEAGKAYFAIKNVKHQLYVSDFVDSEGYKELNKFVLSERRDTFLLQSWGKGQFAIIREGHDRQQWHACDHNQGTPTKNAASSKSPGGISGITGSVITWAGSLNDPSSWTFRELQKLPYEAKSISEVNFQSETISLYTGINTVVLTADKDCAFADLVITNVVGDVVEPTSVKVEGKVATIEVETSLGEFMFSFTNNEGVTEVVVDGSLVVVNNGPSAEFTKLQNAYNAAVTKAPVLGEAVGQFADLSEYDAALTAAQELLDAEEEAAADVLVAAANAVDSAVAHLKVNLPVPGKSYYIILGGYDFWSNFGTDMAMYTKQDAAGQDFVYWAYVNVHNSNYLWQFEDSGQLVGGAPAYFLKNVGTGLYMCPTLNRDHRYLVDDASETQPYEVKSVNGGMVAIGDNSTVTDGYAYLHPMSHNSGSGTFGNMISWSATDKASAMRVVEAEAYLTDYLNAAGIEDVEIASEQVTPAKKGIYDLFGRRIEAPTATGIYIVDGKKKVIKK